MFVSMNMEPPIEATYKSYRLRSSIIHPQTYAPKGMNTRETLFLTAVAAFASGFFAGMLLAPSSGRDARRRLAQTAQGSTRWVGEQLQSLEAQLSVLEQQIQTASSQFGEKMRGAAKKAVDPYLPSFPDDAEEWKVDRKEVTQDLRRMPRK